jgi:hypothetical protein
MDAGYICQVYEDMGVLYFCMLHKIRLCMLYKIHTQVVCVCYATYIHRLFIYVMQDTHTGKGPPLTGLHQGPRCLLAQIAGGKRTAAHVSYTHPAAHISYIHPYAYYTTGPPTICLRTSGEIIVWKVSSGWSNR